ncbi:MAG: FGGY family carbohydrate kinase, partial [Geminicoccaceae bacterium]
MNALYVGIDFGTSGCRAAAIDQGGRPAGQFAVAMPPDRDGAAVEQDPHIWWTALQQALCGLLDNLDRDAVRSLAVDGTSGTLLLTDGGAAPLGPALMYNDARAEGEAAEIGTVAPAESGVLGASSALAKLLHLQKSEPASGARHALHQADWIAGRLSGKLGISDHNNALKLGYDVIADR